MKNFLIGLAVALSLGISSGVYAFNRGWERLEAIRSDLPRIDDPGDYRPKEKTRILAADGTLLTEIYRENREFLALEQIPQSLRQATIASEDRRFYEHIGISPFDIGRAAMANYRRKTISQGASTITQQLARDVYLSSERTWQRKVKEALLAIELEKRYTKDELLELYLNEINYGKGSYGCRTAARMYFGKEPAQLTLSEAATLATVPRRPASYHLYGDLKAAAARRDQVLDRMVQADFITRDQSDKAKREKLTIKPYVPPDFKPLHAPYYTAYAVHELVELLGEDRVYTGGLTVKTNLRLGLQEVSDDAVRGAVERASDRGASQGAAVLIEARTGQIMAMTGGLDWSESQFNRVTQSHRQPGSAFKPFVYTAAIDSGFKPTDTINDTPFELRLGPNDVWRPRNYDGVFHGTVTLQDALAQSINVPAVRLCQRVGISTVTAFAQRMGIRSQLRPYLSLALGSSEVTLLELVSAYGCFPTMGFRVQPTTLAEVTDATGRTVYRAQPKVEQVLNPRTADSMVSMLAEAMNSGTGKPASFGGPHGGKTGTTSDNKDAWFIGFTPQFVCGVWLGDDHNEPMHGVYGGQVCGPAWRKIMLAVIAARGTAGEWPRPWYLQSPSGDPAAPLAIDGDKVKIKVRVCTESGLLAGPHCPAADQEFTKGEEPQTHCMLHDDVVPTAPAPMLLPPDPSPVDPASKSGPQPSDVSPPARLNLPEPPREQHQPRGEVPKGVEVR